MDFKSLKEFIKLAKEEGVASLKYETDKVKLGVSFTPEGQSVVYHPQAAPTTGEPLVERRVNPSKLSENFGKQQIPYHEIKSPFVGTFYAAPSPDDSPYVKKGDKIEVGKTLCIVEAMKIMNEIESEVSGVVVETLVENESFVEFGQILFRIQEG